MQFPLRLNCPPLDAQSCLAVLLTHRSFSFTNPGAHSHFPTLLTDIPAGHTFAVHFPFRIVCPSGQLCGGLLTLLLLLLLLGMMG